MSAGIWVIHRAGKSGGEWWRFLTDTVMMVWVLVYGSYIELANLGLSWWCFLTDTVMLVWVLVYGSYKEVANLWVSGDTFWQLLSWWYECNELSLLNDCLWYDKLWGPSQRVVTLLYLSISVLSYRWAAPLCTASNVLPWWLSLVQLLSPPQVAGHRSGGAGGEQEGGAQQRSSLNHLRGWVQRWAQRYCFKGEMQSRIDKILDTYWNIHRT